MKSKPDQLILNAIAAETALSEKIHILMKYKSRISALLNETTLSDVQRDNLKHTGLCCCLYCRG